MKTFYWVNTKKYCGCIAVDNKNKIYSKDTAPCYRWMSGKKFSQMISWLKNKKYLIGCQKIGEGEDQF